MSDNWNRFVPQAGAVVDGWGFQDWCKILSRPDFSAEEALNQWYAVDVVVVEMGDENRVDSVNAESALEGVHTVK